MLLCFTHHFTHNKSLFKSFLKPFFHHFTQKNYATTHESHNVTKNNETNVPKFNLEFCQFFFVARQHVLKVVVKMHIDKMRYAVTNARSHHFNDPENKNKTFLKLFIYFKYLHCVHLIPKSYRRMNHPASVELQMFTRKSHYQTRRVSSRFTENKFEMFSTK